MPSPRRPIDRQALARAQRVLRRRRHEQAGIVVGAPARADGPTVAQPGPPPANGGQAARRGPVIDVRNVDKVYGSASSEVHALRDVSLQIERGEFVAIMGTSGSGKSTLMHILGCLDLPTRGTYLLRGRDVSEADEDALSDVRNRYIGFVFQSFNLIPRTSAIANVELPLTYAGMPASMRRSRAMQALTAVGLRDRADHLPSELSGGQQQRAAVARALVTNPAMILADEPTGNLDSRSTEEVLEIFEQLGAQGRTIVLITHEQDVAERAARLVRLRDGRIVSDELASHQVVADTEDAIREEVADEDPWEGTPGA